ncbi:hypothetical protein NMG60_11018856 [Bertholletia excelsa]
MAKPALALLSLVVFSHFYLSPSLPSGAVLNAAEILSNSGFVSMALTLELLSIDLTSQPQSATIFSPSDDAFVESGQPSLSLLQLHFSPMAFSLESLQSLPHGTRIPTLSPGKSLIVTRSISEQQVSLNNVTIDGSPVYDDGSLIVFGIGKFFDPNFEVQAPIQRPSPDLQCVVTVHSPRSPHRAESFDEASGMLLSRGYSVMASFIDLQLIGFRDQPNLTVFAPADDVILEYVGNFSEYSLLFLRHVVPCKLTWIDLTNFADGTLIKTFMEGFTICITKSNGLVMLNEVPVTFPDMYYNDRLVVHGLQEVLELREPLERGQQSSSESGQNEWIAPDHGEF